MDKNNLPPDIPPEAADFLESAGYFDADRLAVGDSVPLLTVYTQNGAAVQISSFWQNLPVVLIFGSYT